jgi:hypothetical protein
MQVIQSYYEYGCLLLHHKLRFRIFDPHYRRVRFLVVYLIASSFHFLKLFTLTLYLHPSLAFLVVILFEVDLKDLFYS